MDDTQLYAIDDFLNDVSDQAAAWYSIIANRAVIVPSAQIAAQKNQAAAVAPAGVVSTPFGTSISSNTLLLIAGAAVLAVLIWKVA